jgi:hypothetical protein
MPITSGSRLPFARSTHAGLSTLSTVSTAEPEAEYAGPFQIIVRASAYAAAEIHLRIIMISPWRCSAVTRD